MYHEKSVLCREVVPFSEDPFIYTVLLIIMVTDNQGGCTGQEVIVTSAVRSAPNSAHFEITGTSDLILDSEGYYEINLYNGSSRKEDLDILVTHFKAHS